MNFENSNSYGGSPLVSNTKINITNKKSSMRPQALQFINDNVSVN